MFRVDFVNEYFFMSYFDCYLFISQVSSQLHVGVNSLNFDLQNFWHTRFNEVFVELSNLPNYLLAVTSHIFKKLF